MACIRCNELLGGKVSYRIQAKVKDVRTGKWLAKPMTWRPPDDMPRCVSDYEVKKIAEEFELKAQQQARGLLAIDNKIAFIDYAEQWSENLKRTKTMAYYLNTVNFIEKARDYFGRVKLCEMSPIIIQGFIDNLQNNGYIRTTTRLKDSKDVRQVLKSQSLKICDIVKSFKIPKSTFYAFESRRPISYKMATLLSKALNIDINEYFEIQEKRCHYAKESLKRVKRTLSAILSAAKRKRLIEHNFASSDYIDEPIGYKKEMKTLSIEDAQCLNKFLETADIPEQWKIGIAIPLFLGLRRGEIAGLEWDDVNFENKTITVRRSVNTYKGYGEICKEPKTKSSIRTIAVPTKLINKLIDYKAWWELRKETLGDAWKETKRVLCNTDGGTISPGLIRNWLIKVLKMANLPQITLHELRHTNISIQLAIGVDLKTVSVRAGHSRVSTTGDIYSHFLKSPDFNASEKIDKIFNKQ